MNACVRLAYLFACIYLDKRRKVTHASVRWRSSRSPEAIQSRRHRRSGRGASLEPRRPGPSRSLDPRPHQPRHRARRAFLACASQAWLRLHMGGSSAVLDQASAAYPLDAALPPLGVQLLLGHGIFEEHAERARLVQGGVVQRGVVQRGVGWGGGGDMQ